MQRALIIFVRNPELGKVKTRLAATIGAEAALHVYRKLLQHTRDTTLHIEADKFVFYADAIVEDDLWQQEGYVKVLQQDGNLGQRMRAAFTHVFNSGYEHIAIIGSDCPQLTENHLQQTFSNLHTYDVVIGPANDGGYYLLGLKALHPKLFEGKDWSTETVYRDTLSAIEKSNLAYCVLEKLTDVDEEKDLPVDWKREINNLFHLA